MSERRWCNSEIAKQSWLLDFDTTRVGGKANAVQTLFATRRCHIIAPS